MKSLLSLHDLGVKLHYPILEDFVYYKDDTTSKAYIINFERAVTGYRCEREGPCISLISDRDSTLCDQILDFLQCTRTIIRSGISSSDYAMPSSLRVQLDIFW